jgi:hypothetical protein
VLNFEIRKQPWNITFNMEWNSSKNGIHFRKTHNIREK